jgi:hexosaminidase
VGLASNQQCDEKSRASELGSVGKLLAEFVTDAARYLHDRGREVIFWGEYPLKPEDVPALPKFLINGEVNTPEFNRAFRAHGIRQMIYTSSEGEERLFPEYFPLPGARLLHERSQPASRVTEVFEKISFDPARTESDLIGEINAGWADMGLHPETFWLGYATSAAAGWHRGATSPEEIRECFYRQFYGTNVASMNRLYQLMSYQAQFWFDSWDQVDSHARKPIWGNSAQIFQPRRPAHDQSIALSSPELSASSDWSSRNRERLQLARNTLAENDELVGLIVEDLPRVKRNGYSLEVFLSIARICRQNLEFLNAFGRIDTMLESARAAVRSGQSQTAIRAVDQALDLAVNIRKSRNRVFRETVEVWSKTWQPRVKEANGRRFLHELDDVKDHLPDRTVDMSYLFYRDLLLPLDDWYAKVEAERNALAKAAGQPARQDALDWRNLSDPQ